MNAVEGMASGLVVYQIYLIHLIPKCLGDDAFLNECPIVSSNPEHSQNLEQLILNRKLRELLGSLGIQPILKNITQLNLENIFKKSIINY